MGATVAGFGGEVCRHLWENRACLGREEEIRNALTPSLRGNWVMRFIFGVGVVDYRAPAPGTFQMLVDAWSKRQNRTVTWASSSSPTSIYSIPCF